MRKNFNSFVLNCWHLYLKQEVTCVCMCVYIHSKQKLKWFLDPLELPLWLRTGCCKPVSCHYAVHRKTPKAQVLTVLPFPHLWPRFCKCRYTGEQHHRVNSQDNLSDSVTEQASCWISNVLWEPGRQGGWSVLGEKRSRGDTADHTANVFMVSFEKSSLCKISFSC